MKTIGFVGTAKNTGKTTTAIHLLEQASAAGICTALTSIGFDGESTDHVTGLPKPRYAAQKGMLVATALPCLRAGTAQFTDVVSTGLRTILGEVVLATVAGPGNVVLAGPNRKTDLQVLLRLLEARGVELTLVDGALNRLAALTAADGILLSTGAAYDENIPALAAHAAAIESLFHYPEFSTGQALDVQRVTLLAPSGETRQLALGSVLQSEAACEIADWLVDHPAGTCITPGVFDPRIFQEMLAGAAAFAPGSRFVFNSPLSLLAAGSPQVWQRCFAHLAAQGCPVNYLAPVQLYGMTVNPFYPRYLQKTGQYIPAYVDKIDLLQTCRSLIHATLVLDIYQPPPPDLSSLCGLHLPEGG